MKFLVTILLLTLSIMAANIKTTVQNNGQQVYLIEKGQSFMHFTPHPKEVIHAHESDFFTASTTIQQISSLKLIYSSHNDNYHPACEFIIEIQQDALSQLFVVKKIVTNKLRPIVGLKCDNNMLDFNPSTGDADVLMNMTIPNSAKHIKKIH